MRDFLFARPSLIEGIARNIDIFGTMQIYNYSASPEEADTKALREDWAAVGNDLRSAIQEHKNSLRKDA